MEREINLSGKIRFSYMPITETLGFSHGISMCINDVSEDMSQNSFFDFNLNKHVVDNTDLQVNFNI